MASAGNLLEASDEKGIINCRAILMVCSLLWQTISLAEVNPSTFFVAGGYMTEGPFGTYHKLER